MQDIAILADMFKQGLESGLSKESLVKSLMLTDGELEEIEEFYPEVKLLQRTGQIQDYLDLYELTRMGASPTPLFISRSKTVWKSFYPQEEDQSDEDRIRNSAKSIIDIISKRTESKE